MHHFNSLNIVYEVLYYFLLQDFHDSWCQRYWSEILHGLWLGIFRNLELQFSWYAWQKFVAKVVDHKHTGNVIYWYSVSSYGLRSDRRNSALSGTSKAGNLREVVIRIIAFPTKMPKVAVQVFEFKCQITIRVWTKKKRYIRWLLHNILLMKLVLKLRKSWAKSKTLKCKIVSVSRTLIQSKFNSSHWTTNHEHEKYY